MGVGYRPKLRSASVKPRMASVRVRLKSLTGPDLAIAGVVAVQLLPLLILKNVGSVDGPAHVLGAYVLGGAEQQIYDTYYYRDNFPLPNLLTQYLLAGLLEVVSPTTAEKLVVGLYLVGFAYALRRAVLSVRPDASWVVPVGLVLSTSTFLMWGFYNFSYGVVAFLLGVAHVQRHRRSWTKRSGLGLSAILLLCYFTHLVPLVMLALFLCTTTAIDLYLDPPASRRQLFHRIAPPVLALVPVGVLTLAFLARPAGEGIYLGYDLLPIHLVGLLTLQLPLVTYSLLEFLPLLVLVCSLVLLLGALIHHLRHFRSDWRSPALVTLVVTLALYVVVPESFGQGGLMHARLAMFPPLLLLLAVAAIRPPSWLRATATVAGCVVALGVVVLRFPVQLEFDRKVQAYRELSSFIEPQSLLVGFRLRSEEPAASGLRRLVQDPLLHAPSLVALMTGGVDAGHYEAATSYFPVRFHRERNAFVALGKLEEAPPDVDLSAVPELRYVMLWRNEPARRLPSDARHLMNQLKQGFRPVTQTANGKLVLYERQSER